MGYEMRKSLLLNVTYIVKPGLRDKFMNRLKEENIQKLSSLEDGNLEYQYTISDLKSEINNIRLKEIWIDRESWIRHTKTAHYLKLREIKEQYVEDVLIEEKSLYIVSKTNAPISGLVIVPGSKSMTNRALLLAALADERSHLSGVLFSDDSRYFLSSLISLGFDIYMDEEKKTVDIQGYGGKIPNKSATIDVGSAGTAARFLTAILALSDGQYIINCSEQMKKRPMAELFNVLIEMGASIQYLEESEHLPICVTGMRNQKKRQKDKIEISMNISKSTQYLSAMLLVAPILLEGLKIHITSDKKDGSYIRITRKMLEQFGIKTEFNGDTYYIAGNQKIHVGDYYIEPDVSAACYFYAIAAMTGGSVTVCNVYLTSMQGDLKFITLLEDMGCKVEETPNGICVTGLKNGNYNGIDVDMNDFSDQALTLGVVAVFANTDTRIRNIGHIRVQECNRMAAIVNELGKCGIKCQEIGDDIIIHKGEPHGAIIETYEDHRVAMSFTLLGLKAEGIKIENPECCRKTFENYYETLEELIENSNRV